jgi:hypothetical protein
MWERVTGRDAVGGLFCVFLFAAALERERIKLDTCTAALRKPFRK